MMIPGDIFLLKKYLNTNSEIHDILDKKIVEH